MPPVTRTRAKLVRWQNLRLPPEILELIVTKVIDNYFHDTFYGSVRHFRVVNGTLKHVKKDMRSGMIRTLLLVSRQYRSVTTRLLTAVFEIEIAPDGHATQSRYGTYDPLKQALRRMHRTKFICYLVRHDNERGAENTYLPLLVETCTDDPGLVAANVVQLYCLINQLHHSYHYQISTDLLREDDSGAFVPFPPSNLIKFRLLETGFYFVLLQQRQIYLYHSLEKLAELYENTKGFGASRRKWQEFSETAIPAFKAYLSQENEYWCNMVKDFGIDVKDVGKLSLGIEQILGTRIMYGTIYVHTLASIFGDVVPEAVDILKLLNLVQTTFGMEGPPHWLLNLIISPIQFQ